MVVAWTWLACSGEPPVEPAPALAPAPEAPERKVGKKVKGGGRGAQGGVGGFRGTWKPLVQVGGAWQVAEDCGISGDIVVSGDVVNAGGCAGTIESARPTKTGVEIELGGEAPDTVVATWVDEDAKVAEWTWPDCWKGTHRTVEESQAAPFPKEKKDCGAQ